MPISTMLNGASSRPVAGASTRTCAGDLAGREVAHQAHLAGQAERAAHRAAHLRRDAEGLRRRVGDVDALDLPAVRQRQHQLLRAVLGVLVAHDRRRGDAEVARPAARAGRAAGRSSPSKSVAPRFQIQRKIWRARKRGRPAPIDQRLELGQRQVGEVGRGVALHGDLTRHLRLARTSSVASAFGRGGAAVSALHGRCRAWYDWP